MLSVSSEHSDFSPLFGDRMLHRIILVYVARIYNLSKGVQSSLHGEMGLRLRIVKACSYWETLLSTQNSVASQSHQYKNQFKCNGKKRSKIPVVCFREFLRKSGPANRFLCLSGSHRLIPNGKCWFLSVVTLISKQYTHFCSNSIVSCRLPNINM